MTFHERGAHRRALRSALWVMALTIAPSLCGAQTGTSASPPPTFARDVVPIFQDKCQACHRQGAMAPMSLVTYEETRPWARSIKARVAAREMPPWHLDRTIGIQRFANDRSLTTQQIDTIVSWVDAGAPLGDVKDLPPPRQWPNEDRWQLTEQFGQPDLVVTSPTWNVPAAAPDAWLVPVVETGLKEDRWIRAIETKPSLRGRRVVHHADTFLIQEEDPQALNLSGKRETMPPGGLHLSEWSIGKFGEIFRDTTGKQMKAGSKIRFDLHYHAVGEPISDQVQIAFYFYPKGVTPKYPVYMAAWGPSGGERDLDIPPGQIVVNHGYFPLRSAARLENFQPHMHMRGKAAAMEAIYPDGRTEMLSYVDRFDFNWQNNYIYADDAAPVLPKGTIVHVVSWHDNSAANRNNPDPTQWVGFGSRSTDEMFHTWVNVTLLSDEDYGRIVEDRAKAHRSTGQP